MFARRYSFAPLTGRRCAPSALWCVAAAAVLVLAVGLGIGAAMRTSDETGARKGVGREQRPASWSAVYEPFDSESTSSTTTTTVAARPSGPSVKAHVAGAAASGGQSALPTFPSTSTSTSTSVVTTHTDPVLHPITETNARVALQVLENFMAVAKQTVPCDSTDIVVPPDAYPKTFVCPLVTGTSGVSMLGSSRDVIEDCVTKKLPVAKMIFCNSQRNHSVHNRAADG